LRALPILAVAAWTVACGSDSDGLLDDGLADDMATYAEVSGGVVTAQGDSVANVSVQLISDEETLEATTGADGKFVFAQATVPRAWTVEVDVEGFETFALSLDDLQGGETREIEVTLTLLPLEQPDEQPDDPGPAIETGSDVGQMAPDFSLPDINGDVITLSDYRGEKNVLVAFHRGVF
jgi:hypothetical protein